MLKHCNAEISIRKRRAIRQHCTNSHIMASTPPFSAAWCSSSRARGTSCFKPEASSPFKCKRANLHMALVSPASIWSWSSSTFFWTGACAATCGDWKIASSLALLLALALALVLAFPLALPLTRLLALSLAFVFALTLALVPFFLNTFTFCISAS